MIISFLIYFLSNIIGGLFYFLPTEGLPAGVSSAFLSVFAWIQVADIVFNVPLLRSLALSYLVLLAILTGIKLVLRLWAKVPIIGK